MLVIESVKQIWQEFMCPVCRVSRLIHVCSAQFQTGVYCDKCGKRMANMTMSRYRFTRREAAALQTFATVVANGKAVEFRQVCSIQVGEGESA